jgi:hypothetical protein
MKNKKNLFAILAIALVFTLASCGNGTTGGGSPPPAGPTSAVYEGMSENSFYKLEITKASGRAVYNPQNGDSYVFTITRNGNKTQSKGKVTVKGNDLELQPSNAGAPKFTVKTDSGLMTAIEGTITTTDGKTEQAPASIDPAKSYDEGWNLYANNWDTGQSWANSMDIREFTLRKPQQGDKFYFYVSGNADRPMKRFGISFDSHIAPWSDYQWLGSSEEINIPAGKFEHTFEVNIYTNEPIKGGSDRIFQVNVSNGLWYEENGVLISGDKADALPAGYKQYETVMATIKDFKISLLKASRGVDNNGFSYTSYGSFMIITGYKGNGGNITIPSSINGVPVTQIGEYAFAYCDSITGVTIPDIRKTARFT